jgi:hypothetical protein
MGTEMLVMSESGLAGHVVTWQDVEPRLRVLTYRQIDYWIRTGAIDLEGPAAGSGSKRSFSEEDVWRLEIIERLCDLPSMTSGIPGELIRLLWEYLEGRHRRIEESHVFITGSPRTGWKVSTKLNPAADSAVMLRIR